MFECRKELYGWQIGQRSRFYVVEEIGEFAQAIEFLSHLTHPATRHVLVPFGENTVALTNLQAGSDYHDYASQISAKLSRRVARVVDRPARTWGDSNSPEVQTYEARILEVYENGALVRGVTCMNDGGRWTFHCAGAQHPVEESFDYQARKKSSRFTSANLRELVKAFGFPLPDIEALSNAGRYLLMHEQLLNPEYRARVEANACTPAERDDPAFGFYRRGMGWIPQMQTHAESIVADFGRAVRLNPSYEPLVREHLERAREIIRGRK